MCNLTTPSVIRRVLYINPGCYQRWPHLHLLFQLPPSNLPVYYFAILNHSLRDSGSQQPAWFVLQPLSCNQSPLPMKFSCPSCLSSVSQRFSPTKPNVLFSQHWVQGEMDFFIYSFCVGLLLTHSTSTSLEFSYRHFIFLFYEPST